MKTVLVVGNWKSHKGVSDARTWMSTFGSLVHSHPIPKEVTIVLCVPFSDLSPIHEIITAEHLPIALGAQDVSPYPEGSYTGEESAQMIKELASWVIIGHSERRKYLGESDYELSNEVTQAKNSGLNVIYCIPDTKTHVPPEVDVVGYEPVASIGTGSADSPSHASSILTTIKHATKIPMTIYGGSVTPDNIGDFLCTPNVDGVLVGGASLDPATFFQLIANASI